MKPVLVIPSYCRPDGKAIHRCKDLPLTKYLAVREEQVKLYSKWKNHYKLIKLTDVHDLGETRAAILVWAKEHGIEWLFMFDDDILKVEKLGKRPDGTYTAKRIIEGSKTAPSFEMEALKLWYKTAVKYNLSASCPNHRAYDRFHHGELTINHSAVMQCFLLHVPDIIAVGNYGSVHKFGVEDYHVQYKLMKNGYLTGKVGSIGYDVPSVGKGEGGCNASENPDIIAHYEAYIKAFQDNVDNSSLMGVKRTKTGIPSLQFNWKEWASIAPQKHIPLEVR